MITVKITVAVRLTPVAMPLDNAAVEPSALCPDPSREKGRRRGDSTQDPPLSSSQLAARRRPPCPRQHRPTALRGRDRNPPAREQGRRAQCRSTHAPRAPAPASYWTPSPSTFRPIKGPADQTNQLAPSPATSQTRSFHPACSSSTSPAPPASYWTWRAPPCSTSWEQVAAGKYWRNLAGVDSARRRRVLLPLRTPPSPSSSSLRAGELHPLRR
jgi:hypothetical protein